MSFQSFTLSKYLPLDPPAATGPPTAFETLRSGVAADRPGRKEVAKGARVLAKVAATLTGRREKQRKTGGDEKSGRGRDGKGKVGAPRIPEAA